VNENQEDQSKERKAELILWDKLQLTLRAGIIGGEKTAGSGFSRIRSPDRAFQFFWGIIELGGGIRLHPNSQRGQRM